MADLILIGFLSIYAYLGLKNGFIKSVVNFASTLISLLLTSFLYRPVSILLYNIGIGGLAKNFSLGLLEGKAGEGMDPVLLDKTADAMSVMIVNLISFIAVIIVIKIGLGIISKSLNLVAKLPIIKQANSILGLFTGLISGVLIAYIVIGLIAAFGQYDYLVAIRQSIEESVFAVALYDNNKIADLVITLIK